MRGISLLLLLLVAATRGAAQSAVSISGEWTLVPSPSPTGSASSLRVTVDREDGHEVLRVTRANAQGERTEVYRIGLVGGTTTGVVGGGTSRSEYSAQWSGEHLVLTWASYPAPGAGASRRLQEDWSLDATGQLVIDGTYQDEALGTRSGRFTYRRLPR
jgi:hypothetical protein